MVFYVSMLSFLLLFRDIKTCCYHGHIFNHRPINLSSDDFVYTDCCYSCLHTNAVTAFIKRDEDFDSVLVLANTIPAI